jgi:hypothetical protein
MKIVLQRDGSISIVPVKDIKETLIEVKECTLEQFEKNLPEFAKVWQKFVAPKQMGAISPIEQNREFFYTTIKNENGQESFLRDEVKRIIGYARQGYILIGSEDLRETKYIRVRFRNIKGEEDVIYFAKSKRIDDLYYLIKTGSNFTCTCKGFFFKKHCSHIDNLR